MMAAAPRIALTSELTRSCEYYLVLRFRSAKQETATRPGLLSRHTLPIGDRYAAAPLAPLLNIVDRDRFILKILIKPVHDMLQTFDAMPGCARPRKFVRLIRKANHHCRNLSKFQRSEHYLAAVRRRSPIVRLAFDEHHRCGDILHI